MQRRGVSLVEILLTLLLVSLALIPIFGMIQHGTRQTRFNEEHAVAALLAAQVIERFRGEPLEWIGSNLREEKSEPIDSDPLLTPRADPDAQGFVKLLEGFRRTVRCEDGPAGTRILIARVRWERLRLEPQEVERKLVIAPNPALGAQP